MTNDEPLLVRCSSSRFCREFVTPDELARHLQDNRLTITEQAGVVYNPLADKWSISSDMDVNYMVVAEGCE